MTDSDPYRKNTEEKLRPCEFTLLAHGEVESESGTLYREIFGFKALDGYMVEVNDLQYFNPQESAGFSSYTLSTYTPPEKRRYTIFVPVDSIEKLKDVFFDRKEE